ncbi:unnamed protein product, partial [Ectocarpus sp. 8 AP-2014]
GQHVRLTTCQNDTKGTPRRIMKRKRSERLSQSANKRVVILLSIYKFVGGNGLFACDSGGWDVTPSEAYSWSYAPPQGCSCEETGVPLADCKIFDCGCVCDLTAGQCDTNCC